MREFIASKSDRLDRLLRSAGLEGSEWLSRAAWDALIESGRVEVNGRVWRKAGAGVPAGAQVRVTSQEPWGLFPAGESAVPLWRDPARKLALFHKECGVDSVAHLPWDQSAFANRVARFLEQESAGSSAAFATLAEPPALEGGLLQRLDRDTSGILAVAFDAATKQLFRDLLSRGRLEKTYLALVRGELGRLEGRQSVHYASQGGSRVRAWREERPGAEAAELVLRILRSAGDAALVEVRTSQGLRHVVRAGMAALGAPLVGDVLYEGSPEAPHHQLHASRLKLLDPSAWPGFPSDLEVPPPTDFLGVQASLGL
jgi:23S rRNA pseudouridine1911/1915/1917 synthase